MFTDKNSIIINSVSMGQYLTEVDFQYPKLWGDDTGRNLAGDFTGTFLGIYPKIKLSFRKLTKDELQLIAPILDAPEQTFTYYDPFKQQTITLSTYTGDWNVINKNIVNNKKKNEGFEISFIAKSRRV